MRVCLLSALIHLTLHPDDSLTLEEEKNQYALLPSLGLKRFAFRSVKGNQSVYVVGLDPVRRNPIGAAGEF